jgi:hypothetical protein
VAVQRSPGMGADRFSKVTGLTWTPVLLSRATTWSLVYVGYFCRTRATAAATKGVACDVPDILIPAPVMSKPGANSATCGELCNQGQGREDSTEWRCCQRLRPMESGRSVSNALCCHVVGVHRHSPIGIRAKRLAVQRSLGP